MTSIALPSRCDRSAAEVLLPELLASVGSGPITIDGAGVRQVGQAMLQLLVSARKSGEAAVVSPSAALIDAAELAGLSNELFEEVR